MTTKNPMQSADLKRQCTAKTRSGAQCKTIPIRGGNVCRMHGGSAPQVKAKAAQRLAAFIDPHLEKIATRIIEGLDAQETKFFQKDGIVTDSRDVIAWSERREYAQAAIAALGISPKSAERQESDPIQIQIMHIGGEFKVQVPTKQLAESMESIEVEV